MFWIWIEENMRRNSYIITTSGYCPPSWIGLLRTRYVTLNMLVLQSAVNEATFEVLYSALVVTNVAKCYNCRNFSISGDIKNGAVTCHRHVIFTMR